MWGGFAPDLFTSHGTLINPSGSSGLDEDERDAALTPETPPEARGASEPAFKALFTLPPAFILQHVRNRNEALLLLQISCAGRKMDQLVRLFITELQQGDALTDGNAQELEGRLLDAREWRDPIKLAAIPILSQSHAINHRSTTCVVDQLKRCIREVTTLRNSLAHYAQINSTLAEELRAEGCEGLAGDKATLAEVERALLKRVNNLLSAQHPYQGSGTPWESILASILNSPSASSASSEPTSSSSTSSSSSSSSSVVPPDRKGGRQQDHRDEADNEGAGEKSEKERKRQKRGTEAGPTMASFSSLFTSHTSEIQFAVQTNPSKEAKGANHKSGRGKNEERKGERHERGKPTETTSSSAAATSALTTNAPVASPYSAPANARIDRQRGRDLATRSASHSTTDTLDIPPQPPRPASPSSSSPSSSSSSSSSSSTPASSASTFAASRDKTAKGRESHSDESSSLILCSASVSYSPPFVASPASPPRHHHRHSPSPPSASAAAAQQHSVLPSFLCSSSTPPSTSQLQPQPQPLELSPSPPASLATTLASLANAVSPIRPVDSPSRGDGGSSGGGTPLRDINTPFSQPEEPLPPAHPHAAKKNEERKKNEARKGNAKGGKSQADEASVREEPTRKRVYEEARIAKTKTKTKRARRRDTPHTRITASKKNQQLSDDSEKGDEKSVEAAEANEDLDIEVDEELEIMLKRDDEEAEEAEKRRDNEGDWPWPSTLLDHSQLTPFTYSSQAADINPPSSSASPPPPQQPSQQRHEPLSEDDEDDDVEDDGEEEGEGGKIGPTPSFQSLFAGLSPSPELGSSEDGVEDDAGDDDDDIDI